MPAVFHARRPSDADVARLLDAQRAAPWSYDFVGLTRGAAGAALVPPAGHVVDHNRVRLGAGGATFARAVDALARWCMATLGWATIVPPNAPQTPGAVVAMRVRLPGLWSLHACRVVYRVDEERDGVRRVGFAYGTLPAHGARGEERFLVEWDGAADVVWYDLLAVSRAAHPLVRLARPVARSMQRRFGRDSKAAMVRAVGAGA